MKTKHAFITLLILTTACLQYGMARNSAQYDEEARAEERAEKEARKREKDAVKEAKRHPVREVVSGMKEASFGSASGLVSETVEGSADGPITGTLEGVRQGSGAVLDKTVHGVAKVATLGYGDVKNYEVEEPKANSTDTTKIKIKIPGT